MNPWLMTLVMVFAWGILALQLIVKFGALTKNGTGKPIEKYRTADSEITENGDRTGKADRA